LTPPINTFGKFHRVQVFISGRMNHVAGIVDAFGQLGIVDN